MPFVDTFSLPVNEKRPGWHGRLFHSPSMTFAHWTFESGSTIHLHDHLQEEVWHVIDGMLEVTINGVSETAGPGCVAIVPAHTPHSDKSPLRRPGHRRRLSAEDRNLSRPTATLAERAWRA